MSIDTEQIRIEKLIKVIHPICIESDIYRVHKLKILYFVTDTIDTKVFFKHSLKQFL